MYKFNLPIILSTALFFLFFGVVGSLIYIIGIQSIWKPLQDDYSLYSPYTCTISNFTILTQPYEESFMGTYYDNIQYLPIFNVSYSHFTNFAYENVIHSWYYSISDLNSSLQTYHIGFSLPCMVRSTNYPVYFTYDIDYINLTLRNLFISSYFFMSLSCICLVFSICYIFLYCSSLKRRSYSYVSF